MDEPHRLNLAGIYLGLAYTGARSVEVVNGEENKHKDRLYEEQFGSKRAIAVDDKDDEPPDEDSGLLEKMLMQETERRGRPKALCYEDTLVLAVRHPETNEDGLVMAIRFIHHKGSGNNPKPCVMIEPPLLRPSCQPDNLSKGGFRTLRTKAAELITILCSKKGTAKSRLARRTRQTFVLVT